MELYLAVVSVSHCWAKISSVYLVSVLAQFKANIIRIKIVSYKIKTYQVKSCQVLTGIYSKAENI